MPLTADEFLAIDFSDQRRPGLTPEALESLFPTSYVDSMARPTPQLSRPNGEMGILGAARRLLLEQGLPQLLLRDSSVPTAQHQPYDEERDWPAVAQQLQERYPGVDPEQYRARYAEQRRQNDMPGARLRALTEQFRQRPSDTQDNVQWIEERLPFIGAVSSGADALRTRSAALRIRDGEGTDEDFSRVASFLANQENASNRTLWGQIGNIVSYLPGFAVEFATTAGAFSAGRAGAGRAITRLATGAAETGIESAAGRVAAGAASNLAGAALQTAAMPQRVFSSTAESAMPNVDPSTGQITERRAWVTGGTSVLAHLPAGYTDTLVEVASERAGQALPVIGQWLRRAPVIGEPIDQIANAWARSGVGRTTQAWSDGIGRTLRRVGHDGWNGIGGEVFEERVAEVARGVLRLSENPDGSPNYGVAGDVLAGRYGQAGQRMLAEALAFSALPAGYAAASRFARPGLPGPDMLPTPEPLAPYASVREREEYRREVERTGEHNREALLNFAIDHTPQEVADWVQQSGIEARTGEMMVNFSRSSQNPAEQMAPQGPNPGIDPVEPENAQPTSQMPVNAPGSRPGQPAVPEAQRPVEARPGATAQEPARQPQAPRPEQSSRAEPAEWYYANYKGTDQGPVTKSELQALIRDGKLGKDAVVWAEGKTPDWTSPSLVPELTSTPRAPAKPRTDPKVIADAVEALKSMGVQEKAAKIQIERAAQGKAFTDVGELVKAAFFRPESATKKPSLEQLHEQLPNKPTKPAKKPREQTEAQDRIDEGIAEAIEASGEIGEIADQLFAQVPSESKAAKPSLADLWKRHFANPTESTREAINREAKLHDREAAILWMRMPREQGGQEMSLEQVADRMRLSRQRIEQIEKKARRKAGFDVSVDKFKKQAEGMEKAERQAAQAERGLGEAKEKDTGKKIDPTKSPEDAVQDMVTAKLEAIKKEGRKPTAEETEAILQEWAEQRTRPDRSRSEPLPSKQMREQGGTMGGGALIEAGSGRTLALANAKVGETRMAEGLAAVEGAARRANADVWEAALDRLAQNPGEAIRLAQEVVQTNGERALNRVESAMLLIRMISFRNELDTLRKKAYSGEALGMSEDAYMRMAKQMKELQAELDLVDRASRLTGSETGGTLQFRRQLAKYDYSLSSMLTKAREAKGKELTKAEVEQIIELQEKIADLQAKLEAAEKAGTAKPGEGSNEGFEVEKVKKQFDKIVVEFKAASAPWPVKTMRTISDIANIPRTLMSSIDFPLLRQGFLAVASGRVKADAVKDMFRAFGSEEVAQRAQYDIENRPNAPLYKQAGLEITHRDGPLLAREEGFVSRLVDKAPVVGHITRASERAYQTVMNRIRADTFDALMGTLAKQGKVTTSEATLIANYVNVMTGRGPLGSAQKAGEVMNQVFYSPKWAVSRFQFLTGYPIWGGMGMQAPRARKVIAMEYARAAVGMGIMMGLASAAGLTIGGDPRSSDFGKAKIPGSNTRLDMTGNLGQTAVLASRIYTGQTRTGRGGIVPIRGPRVPYGGSTTADVIGRFVRGKLAPAPASALDLAVGTDSGGEPTSVGREARELVTPLFTRDVYEAMTDLGVERGTAVSLLALLGMSVQTYSNRPRRTQR